MSAAVTSARGLRLAARNVAGYAGPTVLAAWAAGAVVLVGLPVAAAGAVIRWVEGWTA